MRKILVSTLLFALLASLVVVVIAYVSLRKIAYRQSVHSPQYEKLIALRTNLINTYSPEKIYLTSYDGTKLAGLLITRPQATRTIVLCHGYRRSKEAMHYFLKMLPDDNIFMFDFRAHGESEGQMLSVGYHEKYDVAAAYHFLKTHSATKDLPIAGIGISMGGATLLHAAALGLQFEALVIDSPFACLRQHLYESFVSRTGLPLIPFMPVGAWLFETAVGCSLACNRPCESARLVACPVLLIHSQDDEVIFVDHAHAIFEQLQGPKEFWLVDKSMHGLISYDYKELYAQRLHEFFKKSIQVHS